MALPKVSEMSEPARTFARLVILLVIFVVLYSLFNFINSQFNKRNTLTRQDFVNSLSFDYKITRIIDGDTIEIKRLDGEKIMNTNEKVVVRLIGINSPESVDPRRPIECFGKEAGKYMVEMANNRIAALETDNSQMTFDKHGRLLAYVYIKNEGIKGKNVEMLNENMVSSGYAYEYTYDGAYKYQIPFKNLERLARENYLGLWSPNTCRGLKTPVAPPPESKDSGIIN